MTALEAIPAIQKLLTALIERSKDGKTAALVQEMQTFYQIVQADYFQSKQESIEVQSDLLDAKRNLHKMEDNHAKEIKRLEAHYIQTIRDIEAQRDQQMSALNARIKILGG
jgi:sensor histidine kinase YesM